MSETYVKIVRIGISRYYGFVDASFVEIAWVYGNGKPVKDMPHEYLGAYRHSTEGIEYAKFCGITREDDLYKLEGKLVNHTFGEEEMDGMIAEYIGLGKPENFERHKNYDKTQRYQYFDYYNNDDSKEINWDEKFVIMNSNNKMYILPHN